MTIDERTQEIVMLKLGALVLSTARMQAELEAAAAVNAKPSNGAQGAGVSAEKTDGQHA